MPEQPATFTGQLRPVIDFMRQQYWYVYDPAERTRMLAALDAVGKTEAPPVGASEDS